MGEPRILPAAFLAIIAATEASAGAWPREPGAGFVSLRQDIGIAGDGGGTSFYGEYGLTRRVTAGAQFSSTDADWNLPRAGGFLNFALGNLAAPNKVAVSVGASTAATSDMLMAAEEARLDVGLHWGRGFETGLGGGWATASYLLHFPRGDANPIRDAYGTIGLRPREGWMAMLSASEYRDSEGTYRKLTPAVGYELRDDLWGVLGVTREFGAATQTAVGISIWWSF